MYAECQEGVPVLLPPHRKESKHKSKPELPPVCALVMAAMPMSSDDSGHAGQAAAAANSVELARIPVRVSSVMF